MTPARPRPVGEPTDEPCMDRCKQEAERFLAEHGGNVSVDDLKWLLHSVLSPLERQIAELKREEP